MDINISLEQLMRRAKADSDLKARLIATENHKEPVEEFCYRSRLSYSYGRTTGT